jgi:hypothetical protein
MKVVVPKNGNTKPKHKFLLPFLGQEDDEPELTKEMVRGFELKTDPTKASSPKFKVSIRVLEGRETLRTTIQWMRDINRIHNGLGLTTHESRNAVTRELLKGTASAAFENGLDQGMRDAQLRAAQAAADAADPTDKTVIKAAFDAEMAKPYTDFMTDEAVDDAYNTIIMNIAPLKTLQKVKRDLRHHMRKPANMKVREYVSNIMHINNAEIPWLYPFKGDSQKLTGDELKDILIHAVPKSWIKELDRQGRDPDLVSLPQLTLFFEQVEASEDFDPEGRVSNNKKKDNKSQKGGKSNGGGGNAYCMLHGKCGHTTEDCKTIAGQVKRLKTDHDSNKKGGGNSGGKSVKFGKNKTWNRKADDNKKNSQKELNALVKKQVQKELNAINKKRKSDDDDSDEEMYNIERQVNAVDLNDFNTEDLQNALDIDEIST